MCVDCGATGPERNSDASVSKFTRDWNTRIAQPLAVEGIPAAQAVTGAAPAGNNGVLGAVLWRKLKDECCVNPATAHRIVMLNEEEFIRAFNAALAAPLPAPAGEKEKK